MDHLTVLWIGFGSFILIALFLDLGIFHKEAREVKLREAGLWSFIWVLSATIFAGAIFHQLGQQKGLEFVTAYLIEKSLSIDNIFVFVLIFSTFAIPEKYQHRILFWGILGALVFRAIMIASGIALLQKFHWITYIFSIFLVLTGLNMLFLKKGEANLKTSWTYRAMRRVIPMTDELQGQYLWVWSKGKIFMTPLFGALVLIEITDVIFAIDSIPAVFAITVDPFIVYTSNIFAILGLRSFYFLLAKTFKMIYYLKPGLATILIFVGTEMALKDFYVVSPLVSLMVICGILGISVLASLTKNKQIMENNTLEKD